MKLENLVKKGRNGMVAGLLGLTAIGTGGCASSLSEFTEGEGMTLIGAIMGESDDALAIKLAPYVSLLGQMRYQKEVIREGRTQINIRGEQTQRTPENVIHQNEKYSPAEGYAWVNPEDSNDLSVERIFGSGFAFRWIDYNKDGNLDNEGEVIGIQKVFSRQDESIAFVLNYEAKQPFRQNLKIYSPRGDLVWDWDVDPFQKKISEKTYLYHLSEREREQFKIIKRFPEWTEGWEGYANKGLAISLNNEMVRWLFWHGVGEYSAVWRVNGKIMDSITFDIIH